MPLDVEEEETFLSRFAYKSANPSSRPPPGPSVRPNPVAKNDPPADLPDAQLVRLSTCVACRLQWTSRKSAKQKRQHIEDCAKKNALTKDTIRCLIEQEIALVSPCTPASESDAAQNNATLMDSVVPTGPPKKQRRQQVVPTVRALPETREGILVRARDILGPTNAQADSQPTQQFGQSALAYQKALRPTALDANGCTNEPSLTQPFGASALRRDDASVFAQGSVLSNDRKRSASPLPMDSENRTMRRRLQ